MFKKYRFRKLYFVVADKKVIDDDVAMTRAYKKREYAEESVQSRQTHHEWEDKTKPVPVMKAEGFYLVHESLYEQIIKQHDLDADKPNKL